MQVLASGFTVIRDVGNNGMYADTALRAAIEQGWIPGPTIIPSGIIIGGTGGQFAPTPEMYTLHNIVYPEYLDANSRDEIVKAVRENLLFGAKTIKICVDCKPWGYSVDDIKLFISEAAKGGAKVDGHVQTRDGGQRAIDAGIHVISHGQQLSPEQHAQMAQKTHLSRQHRHAVHPYRGTEQGQKRAADQLKSAWQKGVPVTFSTDMDYWNERMKKPNGDVDEPRRSHDQLPADLEGRGHSGEGHAQGVDDQRLQGGGRLQRARSASRPATTRTSSRCRATRSKTSTPCAMSSS